MPPGQPTTEVSADPPPPTTPLSCQNVNDRFCGVPKVSLRVTPAGYVLPAVQVRVKASLSNMPVNVRKLNDEIPELPHLLELRQYPGLTPAMRRRITLAAYLAPLLTTDQLFGKMVQTG